MPILKIKGESQTLEAESVAISNALKIIEYSEKYKGIIYQEPFYPSSEAQLMISFAIIFPSDKDLDEFMKKLNRTN